MRRQFSRAHITLIAGSLFLSQGGLAAAPSPAGATTKAQSANSLRSVVVEARIAAYRGDVRIEGAGPAQIGRKLTEGTRILTGQNASVSLRLPDQSIVTLPSMSTIRIVRLRRVGSGTIFDRQFVLESGRSEYRVTPDHRAGSRFEVRTPVSVAAVRGTIFRVSLPDQDSANAEVLKGQVGVAGSSAEIAVPDGFGAHSDRASTGTPIKLLAPPRIVGVSDTQLGPETIVLDPVPGARRYHVQLARDRNFLDILAEDSAADPTILLPRTSVGVYYLRATALDADGLEGLPDIARYDHVDARRSQAASSLPPGATTKPARKRPAR